MTNPLHDPFLVVTAGVVILAYMILMGFLVWLLLARSAKHPARLLITVGTLLAALPPILYAFASVVI